MHSGHGWSRRSTAFGFDLRRRNPQDWITALSGASRRLGLYQWLVGRLEARIGKQRADMAANSELFSVYRQQTDRLRQLLTELDRTFPPVPGDLTGPLLATAKDRRERDLVRILGAINPKVLPPAPPGEKNARRRLSRLLR